jgi:hypothetical protein
MATQGDIRFTGRAALNYSCGTQVSMMVEALTKRSAKAKRLRDEFAADPQGYVLRFIETRPPRLRYRDQAPAMAARVQLALDEHDGNLAR